MNEQDDGAWFAPRRFGYGAGLPIRWQGWAVLGAYMTMLWPFHLLNRLSGALPHIAAIALFLTATAALVWTCARKTRGGFRWRWGGRD